MKKILTVLHERGFTKVKSVQDAKGRKEAITVSAYDCQLGKPKVQEGCPMALAGQRRGRTLLVFMSRTFDIQGKVAIRYVNSPKLIEEIVREDRTGKFKPGTYYIGPPDRWKRLDWWTKHKSRGTGGKPRKRVHPPLKMKTSGVREWE